MRKDVLTKLNYAAVLSNTVLHFSIAINQIYGILKALSFRNRGENEVAYDLFYLIRNYGCGVEDVAEQFRFLLPNDECETALKILREDFAVGACARRAPNAFLILFEYQKI